MSKISDIVKKVGTIFQKPSSSIALSDLQLASLADNISTDIVQRKRGAFFVTNLSGDEQVLADLIAEKINTHNDGMLYIPIKVSLGGQGEKISLTLLDEIKENLLKQSVVKDELGDEFWSRLHEITTEARKKVTIINEETKTKLKQWITSENKTVEKGIDVSISFKPIPQVDISGSAGTSEKEGNETKVVVSESETQRNAKEIEISNWDEISTLNRLNELIETVGKAKVLFYYFWIEKIKRELEDEEIKKLQKWLIQARNSLGCFGCIFAPIVWIFDIGLWLARLSLWLIKPFYYILRFLLKRSKKLTASLVGLRTVRLFFIIDGVDGEKFGNDIAISTLKSIFRSLHATFLVFTDENVYQRFFPAK
jgi:hypothetical protein